MEGGGGCDGFPPPASRAATTSSSKKHRCRVCGKSFPSGRSLGGHMRSHVYSSTPSPKGDCFEEQQGSYSLRENPKKSRRVCSEDGGTGMQCVECGREFASCKALFGHMRCHSEKGREVRAERDDRGSCASNGSHCSDGGSRKRTSPSFEEAASASNCSMLTIDVGEVEDGAIGLMLLSRGLRYWNGWRNGSHCSDGGSRKRTSPSFEEAASASNCSTLTIDVGEAEDGAIGLMLLSRGLRYWNGTAASGGEECSSDKNWVVVGSSDLAPNATEKIGSEPGDSRVEFKKVESEDEMNEYEFGRYSSSMDDIGGEKRSKFECRSCNKVFDSYQALGGHRASHKRIKVCHDAGPASVDDTLSSMAEADTETEEAEVVRPPPQPPAAKLARKHQCSICNKLFSSGQALGGHKKSHLISAGSATGADAAVAAVAAASPIMIPQTQHRKKPNFFDLNDLPSEKSEEVKSWWSGDDLNPEMMLGVILN